VSKTGAAVSSVLFFLAAPCLVAGLIPWWITHWEFHPALSGVVPARALGTISIVAGVLALADSFVRFVGNGLGTPAPIAPTHKLVVTGLYRHVRNPMYVAVLAVILGQALALGDGWLAAYAALVWLCCHLFVVGYEERRLERTFGEQYRAYQANVPRWIPQITPWVAP
jgi:protein-S-isoprenylcysteine O-methyltransferase Ste14